MPYALKAGDAETLGGKPASAYMLAEGQSGTASGATTTSVAGAAQTGTAGTTQKNRTANATPLTPVCASVTSNTGGTANYLAMFDAACDVAKSNIIQAGSNVGIGTATPGSTLHMVGNNSTLTISGTGTHQVNIVGATGGRLGQDAAGFFFSSDTNGASIRFATNNGSGHEWMRITSAGNVGIGTTTPTAKLEVNGPAQFDGLATFAAGQTVTGNQTITGTVAATNFVGSGAGLTTVPISALSGSARVRNIVYLAGCDSCAPLDSSDSQNIFYVNGVGPMTITSIACMSDAGTPAINIARHNGGPTNLLSSDLTCNGTPATSFASSSLALNDELDFVIETAGGVARRITVVIDATLN